MMGTDMTPQERRARAVDLREAGATFASIGAQLGGVSVERARGLYLAGLEDRERAAATKPVGFPTEADRDAPIGEHEFLRLTLPVAIFNALCKSYPTLGAFLDAPEWDLQRCPNLGRKRLPHLQAWREKWGLPPPLSLAEFQRRRAIQEAARRAAREISAAALAANPLAKASTLADFLAATTGYKKP